MSAVLRAAHGPDWLRFTAEDADLGEPTALWRREAPKAAKGAARAEGAASWAFECPSPAQLAGVSLDQAGAEWPGVAGEEGDAAPLEVALEAWATAAAAGSVPEGWEPPSIAELESWLPATPLDVRVGARVARGQLESAAGRLRMSFGELARLPADAPAGRAEWLRALCRDAESRWRFVRFSLTEGRVHAAVDLSGVPARCAPAVTLRAREALLLAVRHSLPALRLVADPAARSRILETPPAGPFSGPA